MEAYFSGKRELFDGLAVAQLEKDWAEYPVFRLDLSGKAYDSSDVDYNPAEDTYSLVYPNKEVEDGFLDLSALVSHR